MNRWTRKIRWIVALSTMLVLLASTTVVYGGLRWTGIDPELDINGNQVNVTVFWPAETTPATYSATIKFRVQVPEGLRGQLRGVYRHLRSATNGFSTTIKTPRPTIVYKGRRNVVKVTGYVGADLGSFPVKDRGSGRGRATSLQRPAQTGRIKCRPLSLCEPDRRPA